MAATTYSPRQANTERKRRWRTANPERNRENARRWRASNLEKSREQVRANGLRYRERDREAVFDHYGRICTCCGTGADPTIDHIDGNGHQHRAELFGRQKAGDRFYAWLIKNGFPEGFGVLCRPCNRSKGDGSACRIDHTGATKLCTVCGEYRPVGDFGLDRSRSDGRSIYCRSCRQARQPSRAKKAA